MTRLARAAWFGLALLAAAMTGDGARGQALADQATTDAILSVREKGRAAR